MKHLKYQLVLNHFSDATESENIVLLNLYNICHFFIRLKHQSNVGKKF